MIVWITHVKVGHRQTSIPKPPAHEDARGVLLCTDLIHHPALLPSKDSKARYQQRRAELMAIIEAGRRFCDYAGFDPETLLKAFGLILEPKFEDMPMSDAKPDQAMIDSMYQAHLQHWES